MKLKYQEYLSDVMKDNMATAIILKKWFRSYRRWKLMTVGLLLIMIFVGCKYVLATRSKDHIVKIFISSQIDNMENVRKAQVLLEDQHLKGLLVVANSPGGSAAVSEAWNKLFKRLRAKNIPVVAIAEDVCASGCYLSIMSANRIFSYESSIIGSIGAVMTAPNIAGFLKKWDINVDIIKSGPLKAEPNPLGVPDASYNVEMQHLVSDVGSWFKDQVVLNRNISDQKIIDKIRAGGIFIARNALKMGLIDEMADEVAAIDYLRNSIGDSKIQLDNLDVSQKSLLDKLLSMSLMTEVKLF